MKTADEIFETMLADFEAQAGYGINKSCDMAVRMYAAAKEMENICAYAEHIKNQCFPQTAEGEFLDNHAQMRGIKRIPAAKAQGRIRFDIPAVLQTELKVAAGTVCMTSSGLGFITTEDAAVPAGQLFCYAPAECLTAGSVGNVAAGVIAYMTAAPVGVAACVNTEAFTGGCDAESDGELRVRVVNSFRKLPNGANAAYYEQQALSVDGVSAVTVLPKKRGTGTVDIVVSGTGGIPEQALLTAVEEKLNESREICVDIDVSAPVAVPVNVSVKIDAEDGYDAESVKAAVSAAISAYFTGKLLGCSVLKAKLGSIIYGVEGVRNYSITSPSSDVAISSTQLPTAGTITAEAWS